MERKASSALVNRVYVRHISSADRSLRLLLRRYEPSRRSAIVRLGWFMSYVDLVFVHTFFLPDIHATSCWIPLPICQYLYCHTMALHSSLGNPHLDITRLFVAITPKNRLGTLAAGRSWASEKGEGRFTLPSLPSHFKKCF